MTSRQLPRRARIISRPTLVEFKADYPDAADALDGWEDTITSLSFQSFGELQRQIASVDYVNGTFLVFNILGNRYRLITTVYWPHPALYLKHFFTHKDYDTWTAEQRQVKAKIRRKKS